ncbi:hypothetical protein K458DRAFT_433156 [Lentithecium fluviatile CBS 122367]|uniref:DUF7580 domain-containing protein n=1 Tax=Lentithecium fluviatile CBS 122367 TaxID=1168545 RepID=A0A6G1IVA8_9PLEO|nr:hypothetical protein K458DRAFT_433156 [Lentithecium fluviatile CBS 122367]
MEVAGVVLGAVPVILFALDNYQRARDPVKDMWNWGETIETIKNQVFLQKRQLQTTLSVLDLDITDGTTMAEIEAALQTSHPKESERLMVIICQMDALMHEVARDLYPDAQGPPNWEDLKSERINWEWRRVRRSFGKSRRKQIFSQLHEWNTALQSCGLEKREALPDTENRVITLVRERYDGSRTIAVRKNARAVHETLRSSLQCTCCAPCEGGLQLSWHEHKPLSASTFYMAISYQPAIQNTNSSADTSWRSVSVSIEPTASTTDLTTRHESSLSHLIGQPVSNSNPGFTPSTKKKSVRILGIEISRRASRTSKVALGNASCSTSLQVQASNTAIVPLSFAPEPQIKLCTKLQTPQAYKSLLACIAVPASDPCEQARIMCLDPSPQHSSPNIKKTIRLHSLLSRVVDQASRRRLALHRKQRFGIASALSWAVLHLCDSPWLGNTLNDEDIHLFLERENITSVPRLSNHPYLSYSFAPQPTTSTGPATHATSSAQFQSKQIQNITLYTLAIRLIELGLNKPFAKIRQEHLMDSMLPSTEPTSLTPQSASNATSLVNDYEIAQHQISELILDAGICYGHAVDRCLRFLFPGPAALNTFDQSVFQKTFFTDVVAPIQATFELIPGSLSQVTA